jgi:hypothetical protein
MKNFKKALDFVSRTDNYIGILGGEPLIHPDIDSMIMQVIMDDRYVSTTIFTNGIEVDNHLGIFANRKVGCLINFNSEENIENKENEERVIDNIGQLIALKKDQDCNDPNVPKPDNQINMGCNIWKPDQNFDVLIDTLHKYDRHNLRISTVVPNSTGKKGMNPIAYFKEMKPTVMRLFDMLYEIGCVPKSDCNYIPTCVFTEEELNDLERRFVPLAQKYNLDFNITRNTTCQMGPIDIYPDLTVARCFGFSEHDRQNIDDYFDINGIRNYFIKTVTNLVHYVPSQEECKDCYSFKTLQCTGGCCAYKTEEVDRLRGEMDAIKGLDNDR